MTRAVREALEHRLEPAAAGGGVLDLPPGSAAPPAHSSAPPVVVYLPAQRSREALLPDPSDGERVLAAAARHGARRAILVSSSAVFPPSHRHPGMVREGHRPPPAGRHPIATRWRDLEEAFRERCPADLLILRAPPCFVLRRRGGWVRSLGRWALVLPGRDPTVQLLAPEDLARAVAAALESGTSGVLHLAPSAPATLRATLRAAGMRPLPVPAVVQRLLGGASRAALDFCRHQWTLAGERSAERLGVAARRATLEAAAAGAGRPAPPAAGSVEWFGLDRAWIERRAWLFGFLYRRYWRVAAEGLERVPATGAAVLVGTHRGFMPFDAVMALWGVVSSRGRVPRFLVHPGLLLPPFVATFITRLGGVPANRENAERLLAAGEILGVFPEGVHGAFRRFRDRRRVGRFRNLAFLRAARRFRAPLVPFVTVGSAEAMPILAQIGWRWWRRATEWPCLPIAPPLPLPTRWQASYRPPGEPPAGGSEAEIRAAAEGLRQELQRTMDELYRRRRLTG